MTRAIKFRAWDGENMQWSFKVRAVDGMVTKYNMELDWKVMQFTGLTDKTGKEIYEGDLVEDKDGEVREIIWHLAGFYFRYKDKKGRPDSYVDSRECKVVGNIYENPELLK